MSKSGYVHDMLINIRSMNEKDKEKLIKLAKTSIFYELRRAAVTKIHDDEILLEIAKTDKNFSVRITAIDFIKKMIKFYRNS